MHNGGFKHDLLATYCIISGENGTGHSSGLIECKS